MTTRFGTFFSSPLKLRRLRRFELGVAWRVFFLFLSLSTLSAAQPGSSPQAILSKIVAQVRRGYQNTSYYAVVADSIFSPRPNRKKERPLVKTRKIWYASPNKIRIENSLRGVLVIRRGDKIFLKRGKRWKVRRVPPGANHIEKNDFLQFRGKPYLNLIAQNYRVDTTQTRSFLGRKVIVLNIRPKFAGRFAWIFWIDAQTGLVLRRFQALVQKQGQRPLFASTTRKITLQPALPDSLFRVPPAVSKETPARHERYHPRKGMGTEYRNFSDFAKSAPFPIYRPVPLPDGFQFVRGFRMTRHHMHMAHSHYSDGILDFSVFQIQANPKMQRHFLKRMGRGFRKGGEPYLRIASVSGERGGFAFFIMGNMPRIWLKKILNTLQPQNRKN